MKPPASGRTRGGCILKTPALHLAAVVALAVALAAPPAFAQAQRLSGTIVSVDGPTLVLKSTKGEVTVNATSP